MTKLEQRIAKLEDVFCPHRKALVGTTISRVMVDHNLFKENGLDLKKATGHESSVVWCLALGLIHEPKHFFYGHTITEAVLNAEKAVSV